MAAMNDSRNKATEPAASTVAAADKPGAAKKDRPALDPETTLDLLRALEGAAIVIEEPAGPAPPPEPEPSFNPYDRGPAKPARKR